MGLFDFLKSKNKIGNNNKPARSPIAPNAQDEFSLKLSDFDTKTHSAKVISVTVSDDFYDLFPEAGKPTSTGGKREIKTSTLEIVFWGRTVEVTFDPNVVSGDSEEFISKINHQLNWLIKNKDMVEEVIIRDLLALKNGTWLGEDETVLSREKFLDAIYPTSIDFDEKAGITLYYNDGNTFSGHTIVVEISAKRKVKEASIAG